MNEKSLIVFDMDGVLVDVSGSYREAVRKTARLFLQMAEAWNELPDPLFTLEDLAALKQSGGLNNDWDLSAAVLHLLFTRIRCGKPSAADDPWKRYHQTAKSCNVAELSRFLQSTGFPLTDLMEKSGRPRNEFVGACYTGDVGTGNIVKQIFQEIYLGKSLFETTYGIPTKVYAGEGLIDRERLLFAVPDLKDMARQHILAIATGRPRAEAGVPLERFGLKPFFAGVVTLDDCLEEEAARLKKMPAGQPGISLSKPNPWMLDRLAAELGKKVGRCYYVGDMPDDMVAAKNSGAGFTAIGILGSSSGENKIRDNLIRAGADHIVDNIVEIQRIVNAGRQHPSTV